jgi:hypothetical protein
MPPYSPADSYSPSIPTAVPTVMPTVTSNRVPAKGMKLGGASSKGPKNTMLDRSVSLLVCLLVSVSYVNAKCLAVCSAVLRYLYACVEWLNAASKLTYYC